MSPPASFAGGAWHPEPKPKPPRSLGLPPSSALGWARRNGGARAVGTPAFRRGRGVHAPPADVGSPGPDSQRCIGGRPACVSRARHGSEASQLEGARRARVRDGRHALCGFRAYPRLRLPRRGRPSRASAPAPSSPPAPAPASPTPQRPPRASGPASTPPGLRARPAAPTLPAWAHPWRSGPLLARSPPRAAVSGSDPRPRRRRPRAGRAPQGREPVGPRRGRSVTAAVTVDAPAGPPLPRGRWAMTACVAGEAEDVPRGAYRARVSRRGRPRARWGPAEPARPVGLGRGRATGDVQRVRAVSRETERARVSRWDAHAPSVGRRAVGHERVTRHGRGYRSSPARRRHRLAPAPPETVLTETRARKASSPSEVWAFELKPAKR